VALRGEVDQAAEIAIYVRQGAKEISKLDFKIGKFYGHHDCSVGVRGSIGQTSILRGPDRAREAWAPIRSLVWLAPPG
jgi:hypothetical protein